MSVTTKKSSMSSIITAIVVAGALLLGLAYMNAEPFNFGILSNADRNRVAVYFSMKWNTAGDRGGIGTAVISIPETQEFTNLTKSPWRKVVYVDRGTIVSISGSSTYLPPMVTIFANGKTQCTGQSFVPGEPSYCSAPV